MFFDTHAHLDDAAFDSDRDTLLADLPAQGIRWVLNPGCSLASSQQVVSLAQRYAHVYAAVGSHPQVAEEVTDVVVDQYRTWCRTHSKIQAIGEIGLDYHYDSISREVQQNAFRAQMALAAERNLPVIVHDRDAHADTITILSEFPTVQGVVHCYSGSVEMARQLVERGWYLGFTGVLTFRNAKKVVEVAAALPMDRIVLETDSPYLAPVPLRGTRNTPANLPHIAEQLAALKGLSLAEVARITAENGKRLYRIMDS